MIKLPPGPRFAPLQTMRFVRDSHETFRDAARRYGDPFTLPLLFGTLVVTAHPEGIKEIFSADPDCFVPFGTEPLEPIVGPSSMLLLGGARHKRERKLLMPPFHGERTRAYGAIMRDTALAYAGRLGRGQRVVMQELMQRVTFDVILRAVFGVEDEARIRRFHTLNDAALTAVSPLYMFFPALRRRALPGWRSFVDQMSRLREALQEQIDGRRAGGAAGADILGLMLAARDEDGQGMTDDELKDELLTMVAAGHETTALTLAWAMFYVHRSPEVLARLGEELAMLGPSPEPEALAKLPYLGAVCDETMRLQPVLAMAPRRLVRPFRLRGWDLPEGVSVAASIKLAHRSPDVYPEPEAFRPQRFLDRKPSPFEFLPFGGGSRRCLGAAFASYEMRIILGSLLAHHRFSPLSTTIPRIVRRNVTEGPEGGIPMIYEGPRGTAAPRPSAAAASAAARS